jgi:SAM-dependent methyltransferase
MSVSIQDQEKYYTNRWSSFEHANQLEMARISKVLEFLTTGDIPRVPKICDLGCGAGWSTNILGMFGEAVGIDLSDVSLCKNRFPHCDFVSRNIVEWEPPQSEYDVVVTMEVLEHIAYADQGRFLTNAHKSLKTNGYLILTTPSKTAMNCITGGGRTWSNQPIEDWVSAGQLKRLLGESGFSTQRMTKVVLDVPSEGIYKLINSGKLRGIVKHLGIGRQWTQIALWANFGLHFVVLAKKR